MTAAATTPTAPAPYAERVTFREVLDSEWLKIRTVRSTLWTMLSLVIVVIGMSALVCAITASTFDKLKPDEKAKFDPTAFSISPGSYFGVIAALVLGVLVITGEYATGLIRSSLTAVPRRIELFLGKAVCLAAIVLIASVIAMFASFFIGQAILSTHHLNTSLGKPHVLRAVIGGALYLTGAALFAYAIGMLLRHTGGAVTVAIGTIFVLPIVSGFFPNSWHVAKYTPSGAGMAIMGTITTHDNSSFGPWTGFLLFLVYVAVLLMLGATLFDKRDA